MYLWEERTFTRAIRKNKVVPKNFSFLHRRAIARLIDEPPLNIDEVDEVGAKSSGVSAGNGNGVDTNEAAGMSGVISHPAGAIRPGARPFLHPVPSAPLSRPPLGAPSPFTSASDKRNAKSPG